MYRSGAKVFSFSEGGEFSYEPGNLQHPKVARDNIFQKLGFAV